jgi:regulator of protease activity HflC (stomatin/prohibitin superfamily)
MHLQASYGVEDAEFAVIQLAQTTMRSELGMYHLKISRLSSSSLAGKIKLDSVFQERTNLNIMIVGKFCGGFLTGGEERGRKGNFYVILYYLK